MTSKTTTIPTCSTTLQGVVASSCDDCSFLSLVLFLRDKEG
jgi:hypothetical protein